MRECNQRAFESGIYALIREGRMSERERQVAIHAMRKAEAIVEAILWMKEKVAALGDFFLKPSLKR